MSFITPESGPSRHIAEGDLVILFAARNDVSSVYVKKGQLHNCKFGSFRHDDMIGKPFGTKIFDKKQGGWLYMLYPTPELWSKALKIRTQILFYVDISMISIELDLKPGAIVIESGTGSGNLSTSIARTIAPDGRLYTFELHAQRAQIAREEFARNKLDGVIEVACRDVCKLGFPLKGVADAVFLDLPSPWEVVESAKVALIDDGRFCSFSPCIEQVQRTCEALRQAGFADIRTIEVLLRPYEVRTEKFDVVELPLADVAAVPDVGGAPAKASGESRKRDRQDFEAASSSADTVAPSSATVTDAQTPRDAVGHESSDSVALSTSEPASEAASAPSESEPSADDAAGASSMDIESQPSEQLPSAKPEAGSARPSDGSPANSGAGKGKQQKQGRPVDPVAQQRARELTAKYNVAKQKKEMLVTVPVADIRGHTGYLTFATKSVESAAS